MPFYEGFVQVGYGLFWWVLDTYCQTNTSASNYGKCYASASPPYLNKPIFTYTTTTPSCVNDGTCIGIQNPPWDYIITLKDNTSTGKQLIVYKTTTLVNTNAGMEADIQRCGRVVTKTNVMDESLWFPFMFKTLPAINGALINVYDPLNNSVCAKNVFRTPAVGSEIVAEWNGSVLAMRIIVDINMRSEANMYYAFYSYAYYAQESSPFAIIPLDYDKEYLPYSELRKAIGFSINGIDQPGWNYQDIISILKELFQDKAWAVFDDSTQTLYLYNLTPDYVPDWLVEKLAPVSIKVLQPPSDSSIAKAWLDELNRRNAYNQPPAGTV